MSDIITFPNPSLMEICESVVIFKKESSGDFYSHFYIDKGNGEPVITMSTLIATMVATMYCNPACGIAANQLGVNYRIIVYNPDEENEDKDTDKTVIMINPRIVKFGNTKESSFETCLSLPGVQFNVLRYKEIEVSYFDEDLNLCTKIAKDWEAKIIQHEVDHLDGKLFWDRIGPLKFSLMKKYNIARRRVKRGK